MPKYATKAHQKGPNGTELHPKPKPPISDLLEELYDLDLPSSYIYKTREKKLFPQAKDAAIVATNKGNFTIIVLPKDFVSKLKITFSEMHGMFSYRFKSGSWDKRVTTFGHISYIKGSDFLLWTPNYNKPLINKLKEASAFD